MKKHFRIRWPLGLRLRWKEAFCAVCAATLLAACNKSAQTPQTSTSTSQSSPTASTNAEPDLQTLNHALVQWRLKHRRVPANFEEFAASANITIPPPPAGKKYVINSRGLISLVNAN